MGYWQKGRAVVHHRLGDGLAGVDHWTAVDLSIVTRWATTCTALVAAVADGSDRALNANLVVGGALVVYSAAFTVSPRGSRHDDQLRWKLSAVEVLLCSTLVLTTGGWASPYVLAVGGALLAGGLVGGRRAVLAGLGVVAVVVLLSEFVGVPASAGASLAPLRALELAIMGCVGACMRRAVVGGARDRGELDRLRAAGALNDLLFGLYARTAENPAALTVSGAASAIAGRVRELFAPDVIVLVLRDAASGVVDHPWQLAAVEGVTLPATLADEELPAGLREAARRLGAVRWSALGQGQAVAPGSRSGLYVPLRASSALVGLLAIERRDPARFADRDRELLNDIARHAGLAVQNARMFTRLRLLGADEERERFARELHDRIGQALASVAITADCAAVGASQRSAGDVAEDFRVIAGEVRAVIQDVREKLTDLRSEPSARTPLNELLLSFGERVRARSGLGVSVDIDRGPVLPDSVEREVWRVACEAVTNAERHAGATQLVLRWCLEGGVPVLTVADNGNGILGHAPLRAEAYGVRGMRERAELLGGLLTIDARPGVGTTIRLVVPNTGPSSRYSRRATDWRATPALVQEVVA